MKVTVQIVTQTDDGQDMTKEVACVERAELTPATFGVSLAEGKHILEAIQEVVVEWQMHAYLQQQRHCPHCGKVRHSKGTHHIVFRTVFGALPVESPGGPAAGTHDPGVALPGNQVGRLDIVWHQCEVVAGRVASR